MICQHTIHSEEVRSDLIRYGFNKEELLWRNSGTNTRLPLANEGVEKICVPINLMV